MDTLAGWIWNPTLSIIYLEIGLIFLVLTGAIAWKKSYSVFRAVFGKDDSNEHVNKISHSKALLSSVAAGIGVGNLAGVATAIHLGGPGAIFWMWVSALFGMSFRMTSAYLAVKHRPQDLNSKSFATPMVYLEKIIKGDFKWISAFIAGLILAKGLITANLIQSNSVSHAINGEFGIPNLLIAIVLTVFVGLVIIGGMKRIVDVSSSIAPWMVLTYVGTGLLILILHPVKTASSLGLIFQYAFTPYSIAGGAVGYTVMQTMQFGISRGIFSHTSGIGVSPFLQGANTDHPSIGAFMAAITPVIDTLIVCTITALVILSTNYWSVSTGAHLTTLSFDSGLGGLGKILVIMCLIIFAFTTIVNYAYYSEKCFKYLGGKNEITFRWIFLGVTFIGPFFPVAFVWSLGDVLIGLLIVFHLIPLTYALISNLSVIKKDLAR